MKHLLGTGLSGLVGSKFAEFYSHEYVMHNLDLAQGVDIRDLSSLLRKIHQYPGAPIVHFAAFTDVSKAHQQNHDKSGLAYQVNVEGTKNVVQAAYENDSYLIHISTAYVFDGKKKSPYIETDLINPIEWYGQTKAWAEEAVMQSKVKASILRIDQPYREDEFSKLDILHRIKKGLIEGTLPPMFADHTFTPTKIEIFCEYLAQVLSIKPTGIFHATTDAVMTDYDFALRVKHQYNLKADVKKGSLAHFLKTADRPYQQNTALDSSKLKDLLKFD